MKKKLRSALFSAFSFILLAYVYPGFDFSDPKSILLAAGIFTFIYLFVRPLIQMLSLPFNFLTFGLFSLFINVGILYLITYIVPGFEIIAFQFQGIELYGVSIPPFYFNSFFSALLASTIIGLLNSIFFWVFS